MGRPTQGSDGPYKDFKLTAFYDPDKSHCHVVQASGVLFGEGTKKAEQWREAMMPLASRYHSGLWAIYWKSERTAA